DLDAQPRAAAGWSSSPLHRDAATVIGSSRRSRRLLSTPIAGQDGSRRRVAEREIEGSKKKIK
ncbi:hypothetical protein Dimus_015616, partial [Dionaea muscipula]